MKVHNKGENYFTIGGIHLRKKWSAFLLIAIITVFGLAACGSESESGDKDKTYKIGATQYVEHPSLNAATKGFEEALKDADIEYKWDYQSAQGDQSNVNPIATNFVGDNVDLIFANSTPSALGALNATKNTDIPIVFTSVTDAVEAGLVKDLDEENSEITGVLDLHPDAIEKTVEFIDETFEKPSVGLIYNAGEQNSVTQINAVKEATEGTDVKLVERTIANSAEVQQAANTLVNDVDVFYIITDNMVVSALDAVIGVANDHEIPLVVGEPESLEKGGFVTYGIDYHTIGYRTGEMAADILTGENKIEDLKIEYPEELQLMINKEAAELQGVEWDDDWDEDAEIVETEEE